MTLELLAIRWLRFEKRCRVALLERSPRLMFGARPDVLGITENRYLLEIEVKRSLADFRANWKKRHVASRAAIVARWPKQFWFLVPLELVDAVRPLLPDYAGLLRGPAPDGCQQLTCIVKAPVNLASARLTTREMVALAQCMGNQILSNYDRMANFRHQFIYGHQPWPELEYEI